MRDLFVVIESPYTSKTANGLVQNRNYAIAAMQDSIARGEVPFAGHLLYTQCLNDRDASSRRVGLRLDVQVLLRADLVAAYVDMGISPGMRSGLDAARRLGKPVEERRLGWIPEKPTRRKPGEER